jgi:hypothetical protein
VPGAMPSAGAGPQYLVEFLRGTAIDTFSFQRLFERVRAQVAARLKHDATFAMLSVD